jgi:hypothetical protein
MSFNWLLVVNEGDVSSNFTLLFTFSFALNAQKKKLTWDYLVKPGMEEWSQLKTEEERIAAVLIDDILNGANKYINSKKQTQ